MLPRPFAVLLLVLCAGLALAADPAPVNTICPVTGRPIDPSLPPVVVVLGKGDKAKRIAIGIADRAAAAAIKADPQRYADAAKENRAAK
jgi:hypothetical protein